MSPSPACFRGLEPVSGAMKSTFIVGGSLYTPNASRK